MRRWPAFSLVEMAVVLMITGILLTHIPILIKFYKTHQIKQQIDLATKSLGAYVATNLPLPLPDQPRADEQFILKGILPYKKLGIKRKGPMIQYAVDRKLTEDKSRLHAEFCKMDLPNHFPDVSMENDLVAFELSADGIKVAMTRNNFATQCCGMVCQAPEPKKSETISPSSSSSEPAKPAVSHQPIVYDEE